jgi:hypothetical protein
MYRRKGCLHRPSHVASVATNYFADAYMAYSVSALAANTVLLSLSGAELISYPEKMYVALFTGRPAYRKPWLLSWCCVHCGMVVWNTTRGRGRISNKQRQSSLQ